MTAQSAERDEKVRTWTEKVNMQFEKDRNEKDREHTEEIRRVRKDAAEAEKQKTSLINAQLEQSKKFYHTKDAGAQQEKKEKERLTAMVSALQSQRDHLQHQWDTWASWGESTPTSGASNRHHQGPRTSIRRSQCRKSRSHG